MATKLLLSYSVFVMFAGVHCQITVKPDSKEVCVGSNVAIEWTYDDAANFAGVTWTHIDSSAAETTIMQHANGGIASVIGGYNVQHDGNGAITLTNVTVSNSGTYKIAVVYSSTTSPDDDSVSVTVKDPPSGLGYTKVGTLITCTASSLGTPGASLYLKVDGDNKGLSANVESRKTAECCLEGSAVECMVTPSCVKVKEKETYCWFCPCVCCIGCWIVVLVLIISEILIGVWIERNSYEPPKALEGCFSCKASDCCECCDSDFVRCKCCGSCCNIKELPFWYYILWWTVIFTCVSLGIFISRKFREQGNGDVEPRVRTPRNETQSGNPHAGQKKSETKKNKSKDSVAHTANEQHNQGRKQPPPPSDAGAAAGTTLNGREDSDGAVSREHVDLQESGRTLKQRPMPDIPRKTERQGHDSKGRGLSANLNDDDHPLIGVNIPIQKAGALEALPEGTGGDGSVKKLKKKKKKSKDQEDEV